MSGFGPDPRLLRKRVDDYNVLDLPVRTANALVKARIETIGELVDQTFVDLLDIRNIGMTALAWIYEELRRKNLSLKTYRHRVGWQRDEEGHPVQDDRGEFVTVYEDWDLADLLWFQKAYEKTFGRSIPTTTQGDEQ